MTGDSSSGKLADVTSLLSGRDRILFGITLSALVAVLVTFDGESHWFEGAVLIALYVAVATAFWWG